MLKRLQNQAVLSFLAAIAIVVPALPVRAQLFDSPIDKFPPIERAALRDGKVLVTGEKGNYTGRFLLTGSSEAAWAVLTDYNHFAKFLPNVVSSKVLEEKGDRKVIEQIDERSLFLVKVRSQIRSAVTEMKNQRIDFRRISGDLPKLDGYWKIEPVAPYSGAKPDQVLVTQVVEVQPGASMPTNTFYNLFKSAMKDNLAAIRREIIRRNPPQKV